MTTRSDRSLECIHNLYVMQGSLITLLVHGDFGNPAVRKEAKESMKEFMTLLRKADARYMGGEDVLIALKQLPKEVEEKLRTSRVSTKALKKKPRR
jgi:phosphomevalonate kinase